LEPDYSLLPWYFTARKYILQPVIGPQQFQPTVERVFKHDPSDAHFLALRDQTMYVFAKVAAMLKAIKGVALQCGRGKRLLVLTRMQPDHLEFYEDKESLDAEAEQILARFDTA